MGLVDEIGELPEPVHEHLSQVGVAGIDGVFGRVPPVYGQAIVLELDQLGLLFVQEPQPGLECRPEGERDGGWACCLDCGRQRREFLDKWVARTPALPKAGKLHRPQAEQGPKLDAERALGWPCRGTARRMWYKCGTQLRRPIRLLSKVGDELAFSEPVVGLEPTT
jgi:hypothetical protein